MSAADQPPLRQFPDRSIRQTLQHPANLRVLVEQVVPHLADRFDFARRKLVDRLFPLEDWREREADLPFEVPFRVGDEGRWALVVILLEHQSDTDRFMPLRLLLFIVLYWDRQWREWLESPQPREPLRLRPILPIVFYTGPTNWGSARAIVDLLDESAEFHPFVPS